jgi:hypothetical protein
MLNNAFISKNDDGSANVALFLDGEAYLAHSSHPNYKAIITALSNDDLSADYDALFDTGKMVQAKFEKALAQVADQDLSERVSVRGGEVTLDGDPVSGSLEDQILAFVEAGEDFGSLVHFYEKLVTNPLGNVRQGVYDWAKANGLTITSDGNLLGYKSVAWDEAKGKGRPSHVSAQADRVNGVEVTNGEYMWIGPGDTVEMPRSKVLNAPSQDCGTGLHIGTFTYASGFYGGNTVLLVEFNPRDIVSLPDSASTWKLRVCRFKVVSVVTEALDVPVYATGAEESPEAAGDIDLVDGLRVVDDEGDAGTVREQFDGSFQVEFDDDRYGNVSIEADEVGEGLAFEVEEADEVIEAVPDRRVGSSDRRHGKGGKHSKAAEGNGLNPAQDPTSGQFVAGRPNSARDRSTGRFAPTS